MSVKSSILSRLGYGIFLLIVLSSCAGSKGQVTVSKNSYPISMSPFLYGPNYELLYSKQHFISVGEINASKRFYSLAYGIKNLQKKYDISPELNDAIRKVGGEGVINLKIKNQSCALNYIVGLNLLPFWPGCTVVSFKGDIVKVRR